LKEEINMTDLKVLLADDHPVLCSGLRTEIARRRGWSIIGEARTGPEAVKLARRFEPDVLIMEADLPELDGMVVINSVLRSVPTAKIVIFSDEDDPALIERALQAGAAAYVLKCSPAEELMDAIDSVMDRRLWASPGLRTDRLEDYRNILAQPPGRNGPTLSQKERELLRLLAAGKRSKEMAPSLNLSLSSVDTYRLRIKRKLGCQSTAELVRYAIANRIAEP
jgi:DNA-binding NarL/FixJ family response regulator